MNRRYSIYLGLIAFLALIFLGQRWLNSGKTDATKASESAARGKTFMPEDFRLRVDFPEGSEPHRNLFQSKSSSPVMAAEHVRKVKVKAVPLPPVISGQGEAATADSRLSQLKLLGVVFRAGKGQIYLALNKESVIAHTGDTVLGQFAVDKIAVDAVELRDLKTNTIRRIPVSGK